MKSLIGHENLSRINKINTYYDIYEGKQEWATNHDLDYKPTKLITNYIKKLIDKKSHFMFGKLPYFQLEALNKEEEERAKAKEDLLQKILKENRWHSKILKAKKDCSIGGSVAIKLWAMKDRGLKINFYPAQEYIITYDIEDVDSIKKAIFFYIIHDDIEKSKTRIKKETWELIHNRCIVNEGVYDGHGRLIKSIYQDYYNGLDFIPIVVIKNGGLTGDTKGYSDVELLWQNQDTYNKLLSDDIDALKFQMFGQTVVKDASSDTLEAMMIAPGALIDLESDPLNGESTKADIYRLESGFSYGEKFRDSVERIKVNMYQLMNIPDTSADSLKGYIASGKTMEAMYWDLIDVCEEEWTEWGVAFEIMIDMIFKIIEKYKLYSYSRVDTQTIINKYYAIQKDDIEERKQDLSDVLAEVMSKERYINKWADIYDVEGELEKIKKERRADNDYDVGYINE